MKIILRMIALPFCALLVTAFFMGCENETTPSLYDPNAPSKPAPVIRSLVPPDSALAGASEIVINGENFSAQKEENLVYFNSEVAVVAAATPAQLTIRAPNLIHDSIKVKIAVKRAELFSQTVFYKLKPAVETFGTIEDLGKPEVKAFGVDMDQAGNIYLSTEPNTIKKVAPDGKTTVLTQSTSFLRANALKVGPGNLLYATNVIARLRRISTITLSGTESVFVSFPANPQDLDFDANGNIWVTVDTDVYLVKPNKTATKIDTYPVTLAPLRVYNGYLYVAGKNAATGEEKIWRSQIQGETLGAKEVVLDVAAANWLTGGSILSLTFSEVGEMYLGTNHPNGMFVVRLDGNHEVLYPGLIAPLVYALSWSDGNLLFAVEQLTATKSKLLKIDTGKKGAPYYGRR